MITIIGAGPVGSYLAYLFARKGQEVKVFEEHKEIGKPVQCTGLLTKAIEEIIKIKDEFLVNKTTRIKVFSKNNKTEVSTKEFVVDRERFDKHIYNMAVDAGAEFFLGHRYMGNTDNFVEVKDLNDNRLKKIKTETIIGADGPLSCVAKQNNMFLNRQFYTGMQARARLKNDGDAYEVYFGKEFPGFFGWIVPEDDKVVRIGTAAKQNVKAIFNNFIEKKVKDRKKNIINMQAGLIPVYDSKIITQKGNVYLIGDAACQVKATTGGGIIPGMRCAKELVSSVMNNNDYQKNWKRKIGKELYVHLKIRQMLDRFSDKDYDKLIKLLKQERVTRILGKESRDSPFTLLFKLVVNEPRLIMQIKLTD